MKRKEAIAPDIELVRKESFSIVGEACLLSKADHKKNDAFGKFINQFLAGRAGEIPNTVTKQLHAVNVYPERFTGHETFEFICCYHVHDLQAVPEGMIARTFPAREYAKITHRGSLRGLADSYGYFHSNWLASAGYDYADTYDIQIYDARFLGANHPDSELDIYIPVRPSSSHAHSPSPLLSKLQGVFIPVRNVMEARHWYCRIFGLQERGDVIPGHLCALPLEGPTIILDEMPMWGDQTEGPPPYRTPAIMIPTENITEAYRFMQLQGVELVTDIVEDRWFVFRDPDGNMLMVSAV